MLKNSYISDNAMTVRLNIISNKFFLQNLRLLPLFYSLTKSAVSKKISSSLSNKSGIHRFSFLLARKLVIIGEIRRNLLNNKMYTIKHIHHGLH